MEFIKPKKGEERVQHYGESIKPFLLSDDTGSVVVDTQGNRVSHVDFDHSYHSNPFKLADPSDPVKFTEYNAKTSKAAQAYIADKGLALSEVSKVIERIIKPGATLLVLGELGYFRDGGETAKLMCIKAPIITNKTEKEFTLDSKLHAWFWILLSLIFLFTVTYVLCRDYGRIFGINVNK